MIPEAKVVKLINIYLYICVRYGQDLKYCCERFSNNYKPALTDQEIMTIYLYTIQEEQRFKVKQIHRGLPMSTCVHGFLILAHMLPLTIIG